MWCVGGGGDVVVVVDDGGGSDFIGFGVVGVAMFRWWCTVMSIGGVIIVCPVLLCV